MIQNIDKLLEERGKQHGDFFDHARITQKLKGAMKDGLNWPELSHTQKEALEMIQHKIGRILSGNPNHADHWDDIQGYAKLARDRLGQP